MGLFRDERGKPSSSRIALFVMLGLFGYLSVSGSTVAPDVWNTMQSVMLLCLGGGAIRATVHNIKSQEEK